MLHELAPGLTGRVRSLNDVEGDALAVGDQRDPNVLDFLQRFWIDLATVEGFWTILNVLHGRYRWHVFASERVDLGHIYTFEPCISLTRHSSPRALLKTSQNLFHCWWLRFRWRCRRSGRGLLGQRRRFRHSLQHPSLSGHLLLHQQ